MKKRLKKKSTVIKEEKKKKPVKTIPFYHWKSEKITQLGTAYKVIAPVADA